MRLIAAVSKFSLQFVAAFYLIVQGATRDLALTSHPGLAVVPKFNPIKIDEWRVHYQHLGLGRADHTSATVRVHRRFSEGAFIVSACASSPGFVLDVPFDRREEGTGGMVMSFISFDERRKNEERGNKARAWTVNVGDGTIGPSHSPHLVLGVRPGQREAAAAVQAARAPRALAQQGRAAEHEVLEALPTALAVDAVPVAQPVALDTTAERTLRPFVDPAAARAAQQREAKAQHQSYLEDC